MSRPADALLAEDPSFYPARLDPGTREVLVLRLSEADYRRASFLDERIIPEEPALSSAAFLIPWSAVERAVADRPADLDFIFHIGHVGSTLISRLLGELPEVFALREPLLLRALAGAPAAAAPAFRQALVRLYARTFRPDQRALVKASSFLCETARELLLDSRGRALVLLATPHNYLRGLLAKERLSHDVTSLALVRSRRLEARLKTQVAPDGPGELLAMTWLCETLALQDADAAAPGRMLWMDFDRFLLDPADGLARLMRWFQISGDAGRAAALAASPLMGRYSKDLDHAYDVELRREVLALGAEAQPLEVRRGLEWLARIVRDRADVLEVLKRSAELSRSVGPAP